MVVIEQKAKNPFFTGIKSVPVPIPGNNAEENVLNLKISGNQDAIVSFFNQLNMLFGGKSPSEGSLAKDLPEITRLLLQVLVLRNRIMDARAVSQLLATFSKLILQINFWSFFKLNFFRH